MASSEENLLSLVHLNGTDVNNIFRTLRGNIHQRSRMMGLQQRWQELKNRESAARHHNQQLLQQFNRAQDTLREMMATTAAMKTIRMEYELFLEGSYPYRQKQVKEKAQLYHRKRIEDYSKMCLNREEEKASSSSLGKPLRSHCYSGQTQKDAATQAYNCHGGSCPPYMDWLSSHSYSDRTATASVFPPTLLPCPQSFQLQHLITTPSHLQCKPSQNASSGTRSQAKSPQSSAVSDGEDTEIRRKSSHLTQELDYKPVRLSSYRVENGESSSTESRQVKSKKKRRKTNTSSDRDRSSSRESSKSYAAAVAQTSESEASSYTGSTSRSMRRNIDRLVPGLPLKAKNETADEERQRSRSFSESHSEDTASQSPLNQSESSIGHSSPSQSDESSGGSDIAVKGKDNEVEEAESKSVGSEEESNMEEDSEDEAISSEDARDNKPDKDQGCDNISDKLSSENKKQDLGLSQDEHEDEDEGDYEEGDELDAEEQNSEAEEENAEHELRAEVESGEAEEEDADDIISPQQRKVHFTPQKGSDNDGKVVSRIGTSEDSSELGDDDIEDLLAPQPQTTIRRNEHEAVKEPKGTTTTVVCNVGIFQVDQQCDSDESDNFYD
ncbi:otolith matrix protein OMM-64-like isoform X2 [Syngnathoides biaculeatus]|uniref:otolith matrix protein OMM-64-like isoform X2 n=1 Tax=Syngnathoides biaculeatus TaxID=300417 RepID=UPI002ADDAB7E|nr:otolith matrix protein OMM-64-like isoform X2 [Syngnathoides biaculeatus]